MPNDTIEERMAAMNRLMGENQLQREELTRFYRANAEAGDRILSAVRRRLLMLKNAPPEMQVRQSEIDRLYEMEEETIKMQTLATEMCDRLAILPDEGQNGDTQRTTNGPGVQDRSNGDRGAARPGVADVGDASRL